MRSIKESTYNAIKSRSMIGANRFNHKILVEGEPLGFSEIKSTANNTVSGGSFSDYCFRSDGKILYAYLSGNDLYLKIINSENEMMSTPNSGSGGSLFYTFERIIDVQCFSLNRLKSGKILLFINSVRVNSGLSEFLVYTSGNGLGDDFTLTKTINSSNTVGLAYVSTYGKHYVSKIGVKDGAIYVVSWKHSSYSGNINSVLVVYKSADDGVTWSEKFSPSISITSLPRYTRVFTISVIGSFIICPVSYDYGSPKMYALVSTDSGATWTMDGTNFPGLVVDKSLIDFAFDGENLFMVAVTGSYSATLYKRTDANVSTFSDICDWSKWLLVHSGIQFQIETYLYGLLTISSTGTLHFLRRSGGMIDFSATRDFIDSKFKALSINIAKSHGGASTATIQVDNKNGVVNPRNMDGPLYKILNLNKQVIIKQGYGDDLVDSFTGIIDSINMTTFPQLATVSLRDNFKKALDQTVTKGGNNVVKYAHQPIENIVTDLCNLCGLTIGYIEPTGISIATEFNWQSYADAFQLLSDLASFEFLCDESGKFHFRRDFQPGDMQVAWSFEEGVDISNMSYSLNDNDIYKSVRVYGESDGNILVYNAPFLDAAQFNILPQKVLKINATEASTISELKKIAERAISTMRSRTRVITFTAIAVPHLQTGDFIQIFESSTDTHEIYRLTAITLNMTENSFTMTCTAYYYGDSIVPGELPDTTATQLIDPNLNLIPEMTSNTKPSGVARASSVYKDWQAVYSPWRSLNGNDQDFFWDANTKVAWLEYEFPEKTIVDKYILRARELILYNKAMPKDWTFEAFNGEKWIVLDTRTNQTDWQIYEERAFKFTNTTAYAKYRINITRNNGYVRTQFERLKMYYGGGA